VVVILNDAGLYGANLSLVDLIKSQIESKSNFNFHVLAPFDGPICDTLKALSIDHSIFKYRSVAIYKETGFLSKTKNFLKASTIKFFNKIQIFQINKFLNEKSPSIIHSNSATVEIGYALSIKLKIPHIVFVRENILDNESPGKNSAISNHLRYMEGAELCVFSSNYLKNRYKLTNHGVVIYDLVDVFIEKPVYKKSDYFLVCGSLDPNKSIETVIVAHAELIRLGFYCDLLIAGDGEPSYKSNLLKLVTKNGTEKYVKFLGYTKIIGPLFDRALAVVVASKIEGFGRVTVEAMMRSTLVIGRNTSGTRELLSDGKNGFTFNNHQGLVRAMKAAIQKHPDCERLIASAQRFAQSNLGKKRFISATIKAYDFVSTN